MTSRKACSTTRTGRRCSRSESRESSTYFSGERTPINDPFARAVAAGLSLGTTRGGLYLALLQGIAYATRSNLEAIEALGSPIRRVVAVGGGTADPVLLQLVSDACGIDQEIPGATIGAARGDALLAGLASGLVARETMGSWTSVDRVVRPKPEMRAGHDRRYRAFRKLYIATRSIVHGLGRQRPSAREARTPGAVIGPSYAIDRL